MLGPISHGATNLIALLYREGGRAVLHLSPDPFVRVMRISPTCRQSEDGEKACDEAKNEEWQVALGALASGEDSEVDVLVPKPSSGEGKEDGQSVSEYGLVP